MQAIELEPEDPFYYHYLGLAALDAREYDTAIKAYEDARPFLDEESRAEIIEDLQAAAAENGALTEVVEQIITLLD